MHGHNCASAVFVTQEVMAAFDAENREVGLSEGGNHFGPGDAVSGSCRDGHALDANELQILIRGAFGFEAQLYGFADTLVDLVEGPRLCMAPRDLRNRGDVEAFRVAFNDNVELAWHRACPRFPL